MQFKSWTDRLIQFGIAVVALALMLNWAWTLIRPLIPVIVFIAGIGVIGSYVVQRHRGW